MKLAFEISWLRKADGPPHCGWAPFDTSRTSVGQKDGGRENLLSLLHCLSWNINLLTPDWDLHRGPAGSQKDIVSFVGFPASALQRMGFLDLRNGTSRPLVISLFPIPRVWLPAIIGDLFETACHSLHPSCQGREVDEPLPSGMRLVGVKHQQRGGAHPLSLFQFDTAAGFSQPSPSAPRWPRMLFMLQ